MQKYYTAKYDAMFLAIATKKKEILKQILESVLEEVISELEIINSKMSKDKMYNLGQFLDLVVKIKDKYVNIEINMSWNEKLINRNVLYACKLLTSTTKKSNKYHFTNETIQINFIFNNKSLEFEISRNFLCDSQTHKPLTKILEIINVNVDKMIEMYYNDNKFTTKLPIIVLGMEKEQLEELSKESEYVSSFKEILDEMNSDELVVRLMSVEEEKEWYEQVIREEANKEGIEKGINQSKITIAKRMLEKNIDISTICDITGLNISEIKKI